MSGSKTKQLPSLKVWELGVYSLFLGFLLLWSYVYESGFQPVVISQSDPLSTLGEFIYRVSTTSQLSSPIIGGLVGFVSLGLLGLFQLVTGRGVPVFGPTLKTFALFFFSYKVYTKLVHLEFSLDLVGILYLVGAWLTVVSMSVPSERFSKIARVLDPLEKKTDGWFRDYQANYATMPFFILRLFLVFGIGFTCFGVIIDATWAQIILLLYQLIDYFFRFLGKLVLCLDLSDRYTSLAMLGRIGTLSTLLKNNTTSDLGGVAGATGVTAGGFIWTNSVD